MDIAARHGDDINTIELDTLWDSLDYATFNINMIAMAPYKKRLDVHKHELSDLRSRILQRIQITTQHLTEMKSPIQSPLQEHIYGEYIKRIKELTLEANTDLLDIKAKYEDNINAEELEDLETSLYNIEHETSAIYNDLCTRKATNSRDQEPDQDGDTERINEGKETTNVTKTQDLTSSRIPPLPHQDQPWREDTPPP